MAWLVNPVISKARDVVSNNLKNFIYFPFINPLKTSNQLFLQRALLKVVKTAVTLSMVKISPFERWFS